MVKRVPSLQPILEDIRRAIEAKLWYLALSVTLSVPDICASLEVKPDPEGKIWVGTGKRYRDWCSRYLIPQFSVFTATDCWALRGGVIHNGKLSGHKDNQYDRIIFTLPSRSIFHECVSRNNGGIIESALQLDLVRFTEQMIAAAERFMAEKGNDPVVRDNLNNVVRLRPVGIPPHFVGMPVIA